MTQSPVIDFGQVLDVADAYGLFSATVTIQSAPARGVLGPSTSDTWPNRTGLVDLPCMCAADIFMTRITQSTEARQPDRTKDKDMLHVTINGFYPSIEKGNRAVVTNGSVVRTLDISGVEHDSQQTMTRLAVREVTLG